MGTAADCWLDPGHVLSFPIPFLLPHQGALPFLPLVLLMHLALAGIQWRHDRSLGLVSAPGLGFLRRLLPRLLPGPPPVSGLAIWKLNLVKIQQQGKDKKHRTDQANQVYIWTLPYWFRLLSHHRTKKGIPGKLSARTEGAGACCNKNVCASRKRRRSDGSL